MIGLLLLVLIIGLIYWVAQQFLPHPFPTVILVIGLVIIVIALVNLVGESGDVDVETSMLGPAVLARWLIRD